MKQKTITTDKATILLVELPLGSKNIRIDTNQAVIPYGKEVNYEVPATKESYGYEETEGFALPEGNWQLLGRLPDITEEQAEKIVPDGYHKHIRADARWYWALLFDFLKDNEVCFENPFGDEPKKHTVLNRGVVTTIEWDKWQEAQSKVWDKERTYLFIKVD